MSSPLPADAPLLPRQDWPHDPGSGSHVGAVTQPYPDLCLSLSTVFYLSPVDAQRGGTWAVPFSSQDTERRNPRGPADGMDDSAPIPGEQQMVAPAGSIFIQDSRCWHSTPANLSDAARLAVVVRYVPGWMSVEFGRNETGYPGANFARIPRDTWLRMSPPVRELFRHRAEGEADALQPLKLATRAAPQPDGRLTRRQYMEAEGPMALDDSPAVVERLQAEGILAEVKAMAAQLKEEGWAVVREALPPERRAELRDELQQQPEPAGVSAATATARLLAGAPALAAALAQPQVLGVARALLDSHVRVAAVGCSGSRAEAAEWSCGFPHAAGDERGWVEAPFPPARMGLSSIWCLEEQPTALEIAPGSHHRQRPPAPDALDSESATVRLALEPGTIVLLDSRTWRRFAPAQQQRGAVVSVELIPWWISTEFPRGQASGQLRGWGGEPLPLRAWRALPYESQSLLRHMAMDVDPLDETDNPWHELKRAETERSVRYGGRDSRTGDNSHVVLEAPRM